MSTPVRMWSALIFCGLAACAYQPLAGPTLQPVTLSWTADDAGTSGSKPITYNVYAVQGAGPIPTEPLKSRSCGITPVATGRPLNSEPIAATTYTASVAEGLWTFAVEAVSSDGCRSALSSPVTVTVPIQRDSPTKVSGEP